MPWPGLADDDVVDAADDDDGRSPCLKQMEIKPNQNSNNKKKAAAFNNILKHTFSAVSNWQATRLKSFSKTLAHNSHIRWQHNVAAATPLTLWSGVANATLHGLRMYAAYKN